MFRKNAEQDGGLDEPLLDQDVRDSDDGRTVDPPIATNVGILGVGPLRPKGYARVVDADDSERAEQEARARAERLNALALERQKQNEVTFQKDMQELEQRVVREAQERQRIEENDRLLALRLQQEEEARSQGRSSSAPDAMTTMMVTVPPGARGGQMIAVQIPGHGTLKIMVPHGFKTGDQFTFRIPAVTPVMRNLSSHSPLPISEVAVRVPQGLIPGSVFRVLLPTNRILTVVVPAGCRPGDEIRIPYDETIGEPNTQGLAPQDERQSESQAAMDSLREVETEEERREREAFLAALPEDVRREVLAQETAQKRRLSRFGEHQQQPAAAAAPPPPPPREAPLSAEQVEFLSSLPEDLRAEVERDLRAQNAREGVPSQTRQQAPPRSEPSVVSPPPAIRPPPTAPVEADLLGLSAPVSAPSYPVISPASSAASPPIDMFQNLSVRGVSSKDSSNTRSQQQI